MPRHQIQDPTTPGLYTQVSWRKHDEVPESTAPGHVQVATVNERADALVRELLDTADTLLSDPQAATTDQWSDEVDAWREQVKAHRSELTGWYASHTEDTISELTKTLHKAKRQAFGEPAPKLCGRQHPGGDATCTLRDRHQLPDLHVDHSGTGAVTWVDEEQRAALNKALHQTLNQAGA